MGKCRICNNTKGLLYKQYDERQYNRGDKFEYIYCANCDTWQLNDYIENVGSWYGKDYLPHQGNNITNFGYIKKLIYYIVGFAVARSNNIPGVVWDFIKSKFVWLSVIYGTKIRKKTKILDVGGGIGTFVHCLAQAGYKSVTCVDLFAKTSPYNDIVFRGGATIDDIDGKYGLITMNHSFEHMNDPVAVLNRVEDLLEDDGLCLIRIPISGKDIWNLYGNFDYQIDVPRHIWLFSIRSIEELCKMNGRLYISRVVYDTVAANYYISKMYSETSMSLDDIRKSWAGLPAAEKRKYSRMAAKANKSGTADQVCIYIRKSS